MKRVRLSAIAILLPLAIVSCRTPGTASGIKEAPLGDNSLSWWQLSPVKYDSLPASAKLTTLPWAGDYWATLKGGLGFRWQTNKTKSDDYKKYLTSIPDQTEIKNLTQSQIDALSPAEKYDLWLGRSDWRNAASATGYQRQFMLNAAKQNGSDTIPGWTGICNGWSLAAMYEPTPVKPVTVTNPDGKKITFYPGDIKGLVSQIYFDYQPQINVARLGSGCNERAPKRDSSGRIINPACRDTNPASFHTALAEYVAKNKGFVFDVDPTDQVWNQPIYGYRNLKFNNKRPVSASYQHAAPGTVSLVDVEVTIDYVVEIHPERSALSNDELKKTIRSKVYAYTLEMDGNGLVLGGEWDKNSAMPDFLWRPDEMPSDAILQRIANYPLSFSKVKDLVNQSSGIPSVTNVPTTTNTSNNSNSNSNRNTSTNTSNNGSTGTSGSSQTNVTTPTNPGSANSGQSSATSAGSGTVVPGVVDDPRQNDTSAPVQTDDPRCRRCVMTFATGGLAGHSQMNIKNMIQKVFFQRAVLAMIDAGSISILENTVVVPVEFHESQSVTSMKAWLGADPFRFQLQKVTIPRI